MGERNKEKTAEDRGRIRYFSFSVLISPIVFSLIRTSPEIA